MNLFKNVKLTKVKAGQTTGTSAVDSDVVDMQGYEGVVFFTTIATHAAGNYMKGQQDVDSGMGTVADLAGSKVVADADAEVVWLDVYRPLKRYVRAEIVRGTTTVTGDIYALQYSGRVKPETNLVANLLLGSLLVSPAEGTA